MNSLLEVDAGGGLFGDQKISLKIQKIGQEYCAPRKKHELRQWTDYHSMHFVLYGHGTLIANGEKISLSKGDVFLLFTDEKYEYYPDPIDPWTYIWVDFYASDAQALAARCGLSVKKPAVHLSEFSECMNLLKHLYEAYDAGELQQLNCSAYFLLLLGVLIKNADRSRFPDERVSGKFRRVREILIYINNNYRMDLTVQKIARENCLSVSRMMALFVEVVGMSPIVYLNRYRVAAACEMLRGENGTIGEVANAVGVEDQLYFSRIFKKIKGISPREYRAMRPNENPYEWLKEKNIDFR